MVVMFTDLVNSSQLKDQLGHDKYRQLKARHDMFIQQALSIAPTGRALQDTGDGYFLSFGSVAQAVSAALMFQWLMAQEPWPHPFKSRVGLHLGEIEEGISKVTGQADFISSAIDLASRTMSLAAGGQILMTRSVFNAARQVVREHPALPSGAAAPAVQWISHGLYRFKGSPEAVEVFEVGAQGIAPLRTPPDSEKAKKSHSPLLTRRQAIAAAAISIPAIAISGGIVLYFQRPDPLVEMRRRQIEREVAMLISQPPKIAKTDTAGVRLVDRIQMGDNAAFDVLNDNRVVDMRGWKEVPQEKLGEMYSQITTTRRLQLKKTSPEQRFETEAQTTGLDVVISCEEALPSFVEAQRSESFVGQERMKVRKLSVDVSSIDVGRQFELNLLNTYWNSLQTEAEQWFGLIGYRKSFVASMLLLFPSGKPFKSYSLTVARTQKDAATDFSGPRILLMNDAHSWIYWEIPNPESGQVYRLHWKW